MMQTTKIKTLQLIRLFFGHLCKEDFPDLVFFVLPPAPPKSTRWMSHASFLLCKPLGINDRGQRREERKLEPRRNKKHAVSWGQAGQKQERTTKQNPHTCSPAGTNFEVRHPSHVFGPLAYFTFLFLSLLLCCVFILLYIPCTPCTISLQEFSRPTTSLAAGARVGQIKSVMTVEWKERWNCHPILLSSKPMFSFYSCYHVSPCFLSLFWPITLLCCDSKCYHS